MSDATAAMSDATSDERVRNQQQRQRQRRSKLAVEAGTRLL